MREVIEMLLKEVDPDIAEVMLRVEERNKKEGLANWMLHTDPGNFILNWQAMRDRKARNKNSG